MIGSNPENGHPIVAMHVQRALNRGAKLIVIDPVKTEFANRATVHLQLEPEHNIPVINALIPLKALIVKPHPSHYPNHTIKNVSAIKATICPT